MKRLINLFLVLGLVCFIGCSSAAGSGGAGGGSTPAVEFFSDFESEDDVSFEKANWTNGDPFNCGFLPGNVTIADSIMTLHLNNTPSSGKSFSGGEYRTKKTFSYGTFSTKMKAAKCDGIVSSFFTYTGSPWDEIDFEVLGKDTTKVQVNYYVSGKGNHEKMIDLGFDASEDFHEYSFKWMPGQIEWYVDGKLVHTAKGKNLPSNPQQVMMNLWNGTGVDSWLKKFKYSGELTASYEYVKYEPLSE